MRVRDPLRISSAFVTKRIGCGILRPALLTDDAESEPGIQEQFERPGHQSWRFFERVPPTLLARKNLRPQYRPAALRSI